MALLCGQPTASQSLFGLSPISDAKPRTLHRHHVPIAVRKSRWSRRQPQIKAFFNPEDDPIVKEALKEPIAFFGGVFAGLFRLDINEDPLRDWVARTAEAAGLEDVEEPEVKEEIPQEIQIE